MTTTDPSRSSQAETPEAFLPRDATTELVEPAEAPAPCGVLIRVHDVAASPRERLVSSGSVVLGAGLGADIIIGDRSVSRRHLQVSVNAAGIFLLDLDSRNGTFYLGQRIRDFACNREATILLGRVRVTLKPRLSSALAADETVRYGSLRGDSPAMLALFSDLRRLESSLSPLWIEGEPGTQKELVARAVHQYSLLARGPFVRLEPGASFDNAEVFDAASGGTLFLRNILEQPAELLSALLQRLEPDRMARAGKPQERPSSFRVIASSQTSFRQAVSERSFLCELLRPLNATSIVVPPLRERRQDIKVLARVFAAECGIVNLPAKVMEQLELHAWPGNVRELRGMIQGYATIGELPQSPLQGDDGVAELFHRVLDLEQPYRAQKDHILNQFIDVYLSMLLERTNGNQTEAARVSGIDRAHLNKMIARLRRESTHPPSSKP